MMLAESFVQALFEPGRLAILLALGVPLVAIVGHYWHAVTKAKSDNDLKAMLVERGLSAEEIERIMNSGGRDSDGKSKNRSM